MLKAGQVLHDNNPRYRAARAQFTEGDVSHPKARSTHH
jgi:hypothetical protein